MMRSFTFHRKLSDIEYQIFSGYQIGIDAPFDGNTQQCTYDHGDNGV
jgi:hypothetical protein